MALATSVVVFPKCYWYKHLRAHFLGCDVCCCSCSSCFSFISIIIFSYSLLNLGNRKAICRRMLHGEVPAG